MADTNRSPIYREESEPRSPFGQPRQEKFRATALGITAWVWLARTWNCAINGTARSRFYEGTQIIKRPNTRQRFTLDASFLPNFHARELAIQPRHLVHSTDRLSGT